MSASYDSRLCTLSLQLQENFCTQKLLLVTYFITKSIHDKSFFFLRRWKHIKNKHQLVTTGLYIILLRARVFTAALLACTAEIKEWAYKYIPLEKLRAKGKISVLSYIIFCTCKIILCREGVSLSFTISSHRERDKNWRNGSSFTILFCWNLEFPSKVFRHQCLLLPGAT